MGQVIWSSLKASVSSIRRHVSSFKNSFKSTQAPPTSTNTTPDKMSPSALESAASVDAPAAQVQTASTPFQTLAGKVALITGSGRGIGKGIAVELASRGASVVVVYASSANKAQEVVKEISALGNGSKSIALQADVSKPEDIFKLFKSAVDHFGKLDIVVSNAGTEVWSEEEDVTPADFDYIFNINCRGQFFVAQQGLKYLSQGGRIILMSSIAAQMAGVPNHALYSGSKAAVEGFTRSFAVDCGKKGITVNAIAPGGVKTDMFDANAWVCLHTSYLVNVPAND